MTALIQAALCNHTEVVELLLKANADVNLQEKDGKTALMRASFQGHTGVVDLLLVQMSIYKIEMAGLFSCMPQIKAILKWWNYYVQDSSS
jgi:ankyrin repeat protein